VYVTSMVFANKASSSDRVLTVSNLPTGANYVDVTVYNSEEVRVRRRIR